MKTICDDLSFEDCGVKITEDTASIWQILNHMIYWQDFHLSLCKRKNVSFPRHSSDTWVFEARPETAGEWEEAVQDFKRKLDEIEIFTEQMLAGSDQNHTADSFIADTMALINHNSYHAGQIVHIRKVINAWTHSKGDTW
ncbi:hypothetical protein CR205_13290 [Alteribacter lacisalsi]|uniref:DinB family protein n=1 Tax=Alteribacter lacisalsi TaxID=2045244 RepID=A0A2W0HSU2_9BACI|nr:DinB family protein [Alteribacter lacisalsi]PYZ96668.1 hypothetical protein CR205_13290 [Alteribacter lacisalsi]